MAEEVVKQRAAMVAEIKQHGVPQLHHCTATHDASAPAIEPGAHVGHWDKEGLLHSIEQGVPLKHVDHVDDRSEPRIEPGTHVGRSHHAELLQEVTAAAGHRAVAAEIKSLGPEARDSLAHVEGGSGDAPHIPPGTGVGTWDKAGFLQEVAAPPPLHHVPPAAVHDASAPAIPADAALRTPPQAGVIADIAAGHVPALRHVEPQPPGQ